MTVVAKTNGVTAARPLTGYLFRIFAALSDRVSLRRADKKLVQLSPRLLRDIGLPSHFAEMPLEDRRLFISPR